MMRTVYFLATGAFWLAVAGLWAASVWLPAAAPAAAQPAAGITLAEVAKHNRADDCWMAIHGQVYDLTAYLPQHPTPPAVIVSSCGTDATRAYDTKNAGRPHSPYATELLKKYHHGPVKP